MPALAIEYPDEIRAAVEGIEGFLRREVFPRHQKHATLLDDPHGKHTPAGVFTQEVRDIVDEVRMASAEAGFYAMCAPESVGGGGLGLLAYFAANEHIFHLCGAKAWLGHHVVSHWAKGPSPVIEQLTAEAKSRFLAKIMSGEHTLCFGLSEPGAGSDAAGIQTRARADGDGWRLNGSKIWTTNAPYAEFIIAFAVTDPERAAARKGGISAFLVPTKAEGVKLDSIIRMWGSAGGDEAVIHFDDVRLEPYLLLGELGRGFATAMQGVDLGRIFNCARGVGMGRWGLEMAFDYAKTRYAFGHPISEYQGVTFPLAESAMQIHAAHLMSLNVAQLKDRGLPAVKELSMAKAFAVQAGALALDRAIQAHGAIGMTNELALGEAYTTLRKVNIADGTNEILRRTIVRQMLGGDLDL
jgi:acyl-CoA dehydrogenase